MFITALTQLIEYLACRFSLCYYLSMLYYRGMVRREVELAKITANDRVLVVGGGPCPHTALLIHKLTGAQVTAVDNNFVCVRSSIRLIDRLGCSCGVRILHRDGRDLNAEPYTVIVLALQLFPKLDIIRALERQVKEGNRILIRLAKESMGELYSPVNRSEFAALPTVGHSHFSNVEQTILYQVKEEKHESKTDQSSAYGNRIGPARALAG